VNMQPSLAITDEGMLMLYFTITLHTIAGDTRCSATGYDINDTGVS
jgi:hypothetical protein